MTGYDIFLSNGRLLTTINVKTIDDRSHSSLVLIGQGIPDYGQEWATDFIWLLENFASKTPPVHPLIGQQWYNIIDGTTNVWNGYGWVPLASGDGGGGGPPQPTGSGTTCFELFVIVPNVDFTINQTLPIFTGVDPSKEYCPTLILLIPSGPATAITPATINFHVNQSGDVLDNTQVPISPLNNFVRLGLNEVSSMIIGKQTISLSIMTPAAGGQLNYDVCLYGMIPGATSGGGGGGGPTGTTCFELLSATLNVNFAINQTLVIFTGVDQSKKYCPTLIILIPTSVNSATSPATVNFHVNQSGDVLDNTVIPISTSSNFMKLTLNEVTTMIMGNSTLSLTVINPAGGGQLNYDVYLYGSTF